MTEPLAIARQYQDMTDNELLRSWVIAMHALCITKHENWDGERRGALEELLKRGLGLKMLEPKL